VNYRSGSDRTELRDEDNDQREEEEVEVEREKIDSSNILVVEESYQHSGVEDTRLLQANGSTSSLQLSHSN